LKKFEFKQPVQRTVCELNTLGLKVSPGTLDGGLQKIQPPCLGAVPRSDSRLLNDRAVFMTGYAV
jgi:hypothetical protein